MFLWRLVYLFILLASAYILFVHRLYVCSFAFTLLWNSKENSLAKQVTWRTLKIFILRIRKDFTFCDLKPLIALTGKISIMIFIYEIDYCCIIGRLDATCEDGLHYGRLLNHSSCSQKINVVPKVITEGQRTPRVIFFATKKIRPGQELLYNYATFSPVPQHVLQTCSWLKSCDHHECRHNIWMITLS